MIFDSIFDLSFKKFGIIDRSKNLSRQVVAKQSDRI